MSIIVVKDTEGNLLYSGKGKTKRGYVEQLAKAGASLERADLSRLDLSNLDLSGVNLRGAKLDGTDLRGANLSGADCSDASFGVVTIKLEGKEPFTKETNLTGARIEGSCFDGSNMTEADLTGVRAKFASFKGAHLDRTIFANASAPSCNFTHASCYGTDFSGTSLSNADFAHSALVEADFRGSNIGHSVFSSLEATKSAALSKHLPNRSRGALVVGCVYDKETKISETVPAMISDRRVSRMTRFALWGASTLAVVASYHEAINAVGDFAEHHIGTHTVGAISVLSAIYMIREAGGEWIRDKAEDLLGGLTGKLRSAMEALERRGAQRVNLVVAMARGATMDPLRLALAAKQDESGRRGYFSLFKSFFCEMGNIVVCDRRHLALALGTLVVNRDRSFKTPHDVVLVRYDHDHAGLKDGPCAMTFLKDGSTRAVWPSAEGGHTTVRYNRSGAPEGAWNVDGKKVDLADAGLPESAGSRLDAAFAFEAGILADHGLHNFSYPRDTHEIRDGRDGTIIVHRRSDRRIDNPDEDQPAMIRADGASMRIRNNSIKQEWVVPASYP